MAERVGKPSSKKSEKVVPLKTKRKLDFRFESVTWKVFYLDIVGNDGLMRGYNDELTKRGATVAQFFDKSVQVLVTSRDDGKTLSSKSPSTNPSPAASLSKPSPFSNSPLTPVEARLSSATPTIMSRGQKALSLAKKRSGKGGQIDLVKKATEWGIEVWTINKMEQWLISTKHHVKSKKQTTKRKPKTRTLKEPFLKVEDMSREFRPLLVELGKWPLPSVTSHPEASPFDSPKVGERKRIKMKPKRQTPSAKRPKSPQAAVEKRSGYCECCKMYFSDLMMHLNGDQHLSYALNTANYASLDKLISSGTSFQDFLSKYSKKKDVVSPSSTVVGNNSNCEHTPGFLSPASPIIRESPPAVVTPHITQPRRTVEGDPPRTGSKRRLSTDECTMVSPKRKKVTFSPDSTPKVDSGVQTGVVTRSRSMASSSASPKTRTPTNGTLFLSPTKAPLQGTPLVQPLCLSPISPPVERAIVQIEGLGPVVMGTPTKSPKRDNGPLISLHSELNSTPTINSSLSACSSSSSRRSLRILAKCLEQRSPDDDWKIDQTKATQFITGLRELKTTPKTTSKTVTKTKRNTRRR